MDTRYVDYFVAAAKCHSFSEAASRAYTSTASLSRGISRLESELGVTLFTRNEHGSSLTDAGRAYYEGVCEVIEAHSALADTVRKIDRGISGTLRMGILGGQMLDTIVRKSIELFEEKYSQYRIDLQHQSYGGLLDSLDTGVLDVAFTISLAVSKQEHVESLSICDLPTRLAIPQSHPLHGKRDLSLKDFADDTFLTTADAPGRMYISGLFEPFDIEPIVLVAPSISEQTLWLEAGRGVAIANTNHIMCNTPSLTEVTIKELPDYEFVAAYRADSESAPLKAYLETLRGCIS